MKFQLLVAISAALASATPMAHHAHKRDLVTEVVHATKVVYQNAVVIVDQNGNPVQTTLQDVSTGIASAAGQQETGAQNQAQAVQPTSQAQASSSPAPETSAPAPETSSPAAPETSSTSVETSQAPTSQAPPSQPPAPTTTSTSSQQQAPSSSSSSSAAPSSTGGGSGGSGQTFSGDATYYTPGMGACGWTNSESDKIVALNVDQFGSTSNGNENCGKKIKIEYNGKEVEVEVTDKCPGCKYGDLDLSPAAFDELADEAEGRIQINWSFV